MILINSKKVEVESFPNGEFLIKDFERLINTKPDTPDFITFIYENAQDLINLMFIKRHFDNIYNTKVILKIAYMPYSRMDRTNNGENVFTLKYVSEMINSLNFHAVWVVEPHSDVTMALLDSSIKIEASKELLQNSIEKGIVSKDCYLVFPDSSADKRYNNGEWENTLTCIKHRDFSTGRIKSLEVVGEKPTKPFTAVIVDDLCSKGGTFVLTAKKLKEMGATNITLIVAHCEDSIFEGELLKTNLIDKIVTTNSMIRSQENEKIEVYPIDSLTW